MISTIFFWKKNCYFREEFSEIYHKCTYVLDQGSANF